VVAAAEVTPAPGYLTVDHPGDGTDPGDPEQKREKPPARKQPEGLFSGPGSLPAPSFRANELDRLPEAILRNPGESVRHRRVLVGDGLDPAVPVRPL
jgi:hypothetical protein